MAEGSVRIQDIRLQNHKDWTPIRKRLNENLQKDVLRIYNESLYCDWIITFGEKVVKVNTCIVITRSYRFYNLLKSLLKKGFYPKKRQVDRICNFLQKIYYENDIEKEEDLVLAELGVSTPDSEGFVTADSSPSECNQNEFFDTTENLVTLKEIILEKELEEQDHLSNLFRSISSKTVPKKCTQNFKIKGKTLKKLAPLKSNQTVIDMDSGLETASSDTSGVDLCDPLQNSFHLEPLTTKEQRIVNEHDLSSSSSTTDDIEDFSVTNIKNELVASQTKEQKQKHNEEIVIMESSSMSSETGSWESIFPRNDKISSNGHGNHYFIDASTLRDESEMSLPISVNHAFKSPNNTMNINEPLEEQQVDKTNSKKNLTLHDSASTSAVPDLITLSDKSPIEPGQCEEAQSSDNSTSGILFARNQSQDNCDITFNLNTKDGNSKILQNGTTQNGVVSQNDSVNKTGELHKHNFVRSNTYELETDDPETLLRQNNERRQGFLLFQNSIQQYSGHALELDDSITTPHNSIVQLNESLIFERTAECPLDSLFPDKTSPKDKTSPDGSILEKTQSKDETSIETSENFTCRMKRDDSIPIISGGVSTQDFKSGMCIDSPLSRRKLESTPIVSGGAVFPCEPEPKIDKPPKSDTSWVVDMKPERLEKKNSSDSDPDQAEKSASNKSSLGFYVDLNEISAPGENGDNHNRKSSESSESSNDKKNIFSMFIDFEAPKRSMPSRLSQSLNSKKSENKLNLKTKPQMVQSVIVESKCKKDFKKSEFKSNAKCSKSQMSSSVSTEIEKITGSKANNDSIKNEIKISELKTYVKPDEICTNMSVEPENIPESKLNNEIINVKPSTSSATVETENIIESKAIVESKEKSVYMFIDTESAVVRKRKPSTGNYAQNRHSWNSSGESDTSTLCHQRTYSISGEGSTDHQEISTPQADDKATSNGTQNEPEPKKMEVITEVKETIANSFVRLSDLDKPVPKIVTAESVEPAATTRMTRSIPETSWIENKLLMSQSTGCRTSISRLFPHLSASTPSNLFLTQMRSKSPGQDTDEMVSEISDLSSMHSSTALEVSTEETSQSSSYKPHHSADRLGHDLLRMFLEEISPDVTIEVGGRRMRAHKCILSSRCQYFAAMLSGGWVESAGNVISLQGFSYQAVHFAMCHIYSGSADIPETISLVELATLADMLCLEGLKEVVAYTLKLKHCHLFHKPCSVCVVGVLECLPLSAAYGLDDLYRKALRWITRYFVRVWPTRAFATLPRELMEKCYQQHVVHISADNVLETILCCDKLLITLPNVRWAEVVHDLASQLTDACQAYVTQHFPSVLASASFLSLGKEFSWNISRLEDGLMRSAQTLAPEQACRSYSRGHRLLALLGTGEENWSPNFVDLVQKILRQIEDTVVRQAVRVSCTSSWSRLDPALRARIQEMCCFPLDRQKVLRQSRSTSGSRNLDLRQIRIAMQQHSRRTQSNDSRPSTTRSVNVPPRVVEPPPPPRPRTWPAQVAAKAKVISSSESSRNSSPAMKRAAKKLEPVRKLKESNMSLDSLASPVRSKSKLAATRIENKTQADKTKQVTKPETKFGLNRAPKPKPTTILKSNVQKTTLSKSTPAMNKENRTGCKQPKSGTSSTQHSPSTVTRNRQPASNLQRTTQSPYNGSPSLRRSLLLAARAPQTAVKPVSPATNKRLARVQSASQSVISPTKSSAAKCVSNINRTAQRPNQKAPVKKQTEKATVKRSSTFLKEEPSVLNKNE